ncbi:hypothetical protein KC345_g327 [Hortaea werneckii]|nr:hypothetical protein KC345_g327 [Hortaea werneckii]
MVSITAQDGGHRSKEDGLEQARLANDDPQQFLVNDDEVRESIADWLGVRSGVIARARHVVDVILRHTNNLLKAIDGRLERVGSELTLEDSVVAGVDCVGYWLKVLR